MSELDGKLPESDGVGPVLRSPGPSRLKGSSVVRTLVRRLTYAYILGLILLLAGSNWWGARKWLFSLLLFAPPAALLLPSAALLPACLLFARRLSWLHLLALALVGFG